jgi:hypothetical protein
MPVVIAAIEKKLCFGYLVFKLNKIQPARLPDCAAFGMAHPCQI